MATHRSFRPVVSGFRKAKIARLLGAQKNRITEHHELGKLECMQSTVSIVCLARALRGFGDGFATIVLPVYLTRIGYDPIQIGFVLTGALLGTALFTLAIGIIAPRYDLRTLMIFGAALMTLTGLAFPAFQDIALICLWPLSAP